MNAYVAATHQLTPFAMVAATIALCLIGWCSLRTLPLGILLITFIWLAYVAVTYLAGHLHTLTESVGALSSTVSSNVGGRLHGSLEHEYITRLHLVTTGLLWILAALGFAKQARARHLNLGLLALAVAPFPLLALQSYGGEALLRVALLSMPFMSFSAAYLFMPATSHLRVSRIGMAVLSCLAVGLLVSFPFNRYGNERMDYFSKDEVAGVAALYRVAANGSDLFAANDSLPWRYEKYADYYYYDTLTGGSSQVNLDTKSPEELAKAVATFMATSRRRSSFLIITTSMNAESDLFGPWKRGAQLRLRRILSSSPMFRVVYSNPDAVVFELKPKAGGQVRHATA